MALDTRDFKGVLKSAKKKYNQWRTETSADSFDGYKQLVHWDTINGAISDLTELKGELNVYIEKGFEKKTSKTANYEKMRKDVIALIDELKSL